MSTVFDSKDFRTFIRSEAKKLGLTLKHLADATKIHPAYFSRVLKGHACFSADQGYRIAKKLNLFGISLRYFLLLIDEENATSPSYKTFLCDELTELRRGELSVSTKLKSHAKLKPVEVDLARIYYEDPLTAKIHMFLTIDYFRKNPRLLEGALHISKAVVQRELTRLEQCGVIKITGDHIDILMHTIHLEETHPASWQNHINWRLEAIGELKRREHKKGNYHFSVAFSATPQALANIQEEFAQFIAKSQQIVGQVTKESNAYAMGFDLFTMG